MIAVWKPPPIYLLVYWGFRAQRLLRAYCAHHLQTASLVKTTSNLHLWWRPISCIPKTEPLTTIPAHHCFWPKSTEHDVTLTSFIADLSEPRQSPLTRMCKIDQGRGMQSLAAIPAFVFELSKDEWRGHFTPSLPTGRGLTLAPRRSRCEPIFILQRMSNYLFERVKISGCLWDIFREASREKWSGHISNRHHKRNNDVRKRTISDQFINESSL